VGLLPTCTVTVDLSRLDNGKCGDGLKLCNGACVNTNDPSVGCGQSSCSPCSLAFAVNRCGSDGTCQIATCLGKYEDCNHVASDGCETDLFHDPNHCGMCTAPPCQPANASPDCSSGLCAIRSCDPGYANCNNLPGDGCEVNVLTDPSNCGMCNKACSGSSACKNGLCS
jgi:hypothetical protein